MPASVVLFWFSLLHSFSHPVSGSSSFLSLTLTVTGYLVDSLWQPQLCACAVWADVDRCPLIPELTVTLKNGEDRRGDTAGERGDWRRCPRPTNRDLTPPKALECDVFLAVTGWRYYGARRSPLYRLLQPVFCSSILWEVRIYEGYKSNLRNQRYAWKWHCSLEMSRVGSVSIVIKVLNYEKLMRDKSKSAC